MSVTSSLTKRDRELAGWFKRAGFARPYLTVAALRKAKIKPQTAAALLWKESGGGRNVFGHDFGPSGDHPPYSGHNVTERRAKLLRESSFSNGVGPTQLTFKGFIDQARKAGGEWKPYVNMLTGFRIFRDLYDANGGSIWNAAKRYNGADSYADDFLAQRDRFEGQLRKAGFKV